MHHSEYAAKLVCKHCGEGNRSEEWPLNGDRTPLYYQDEPGRYQVTVHCPHCGVEWYVVWDQDPGPISTLDSVRQPIESEGTFVKNSFDLVAADKTIPAGTLGVVKKTYPGGGIVVAFPSLDVEGEWTDSAFAEAAPEEAARVREGSQRRPWWRFW